MTPQLPAPQIVTPVVFVCAWCPDCIERTMEAHQAGAAVSHGVCEKCSAALNADLDAQGVKR